MCSISQHFPLRLASHQQECRQTGRVLIVNEDTEVTNYGEHLLRARIIDERLPICWSGRDVLMGNACTGIDSTAYF